MPIYSVVHRAHAKSARYVTDGTATELCWTLTAGAVSWCHYTYADVPRALPVRSREDMWSLHPWLLLRALLRNHNPKDTDSYYHRLLRVLREQGARTCRST